MKTEGFGGRIHASRNDDAVIDGVRSDRGEAVRAGVRMRECASSYCKKRFYSRQEGDRYCCEQCDIDMHPAYDVRPAHIPDPGWQ